MKQLEKLIPKYAMDILKFDGYSLIQNNDKYVIVLEDKIITSSEESIFIAKWINNHLSKIFINIKNYDLSSLTIEECIKYRECIIELEKISHDK
ncbi:MAG: hypothetical protein LUF02_08980 [Erysipelotrichaceae bacterium]|nr:hypothetical protein [Erysipelotrichaceae bacterium]